MFEDYGGNSDRFCTKGFTARLDGSDIRQEIGVGRECGSFSRDGDPLSEVTEDCEPAPPYSTGSACRTR